MLKHILYGIIFIVLVSCVSADITYCDKCWTLTSNTENIIETTDNQVSHKDKLNIELKRDFKTEYVKYKINKEQLDQKQSLADNWQLTKQQIDNVESYPVNLYYRNCTFNNETSEEKCTLIDYSHKLKTKSVNILTSKFDFSQIPFENNLVLKIGFDTLIYDSSVNKITVTGYTANIPCTFDDLYTEDKAGTLDLWIGTPAINIALTTQIQPSDEIALKIDFILIGSGAGAGNTIGITGTDKDGNAQTETLTTTADGTFTTTKWFKTITDVDCNGFNTGTLTIRQNQWGVIHDLTHLQTVKMGYSIDAFIYIGAAGVHGYFGDTKKTILVERHKSYKTYVNFMEAMDDYGHITFGIPDLINKRGYNGVDFTTFIRHTSKRGKKPFIKGKDVNCYGCDFQGLMSRANYHRTYTLDYCDGNLYDNTFYQWYYPIAHGGDNLDINGLNAADCLSPFESCSPLMTLNDIKSYNQNFGLYCGGMVIRDMVMSGITATEIYMRYAMNLYMIDCILEAWSVGSYHPTYRIYRQYTFNLLVTDVDGNPINNTNVTLRYANSTIAFNNITTINGTIDEQIVTMGHYKQATGDTLQTNNPFDITIDADNYLTKEFQFNLTDKTDWTISLEQPPIVIDGTLIVKPNATLVIRKCGFWGGIIFIPLFLLVFMYKLINPRYKLVKREKNDKSET